MEWARAERGWGETGRRRYPSGGGAGSWAGKCSGGGRVRVGGERWNKGGRGGREGCF